MAQKTSGAVTETEQILEVQQDTAHIQTEQSKSLGIPPPCSDFTLKDEGGLQQVASQLTERVYPLENVVWNSLHTQGKILKTFSFPRDFFAMKGIANLAYIKNFTYWNTDIEFEVQITAPKMVYGTLGVSYAYGIKDLDTIEQSQREHVAALCQQFTEFLDLTTNTKLCITIPYKSYKTYGLIDGDTSIKDSLLDMVQVRLFVLLPLKTTVVKVSKVNIQTFIALKNLKLSGIRYKPEMLSTIATKAAEKILNYYLPDANRDNPTDIIQPTQVILRNSQPLCYGSGIPEVTQQLRLFSGATTPFPFGCGDEMSLRYVATRPGLLGFTSLTGAGCFKAEVSPMAKPSKELVVKENGILTLYYYSPLAIVSSMASRWRGSIKYTFIIPHNQFIVGKIIVGYVPGGCELSPTATTETILLHLKNAYHTTFELGTSGEFTFEVPYISDTPFRTMTRDSSGCSGTLYVMPMSPIITTDGIAADISAAIFISAGSTYEIMVPRIPRFGIGYDRAFGTEQDYLVPIAGHGLEDGVTLDVWRYFADSKKLLFRYGNTTDHIAQFNKNTKNVLWKAKKPFEYKYKSTVDKETKESVWVLTWFACPIWIDSYWYLAPFESEIKARAFALRADNKWFIDLPTDYVSVSEYIHPKTMEIEDTGVKVVYPPTPTNPEAGTNVALSSKLESLSMKQFGERMLDLKDLMRRYNPFGISEITIKKEVIPGYVLFEIPVQFLAPPEDYLGTNPTARRFLREGAITLLGSGFRFGRGSLRYKLIFSTPEGCGIVLGVYHDPDSNHSSHKITTPLAYEFETFIETGFAGVVQDIGVNSIIDIEAPYYKTTEYQSIGHLREKDIPTERLASLQNGSIKVIAHSKPQQEFKLTMNVLYAFADDCRYSVFNGFGPVVMRDEVPRSKVSVRSSIMLKAFDMDAPHIMTDPSNEDDPPVIVHPTERTTSDSLSSLETVHDVDSGQLSISLQDQAAIAAEMKAKEAARLLRSSKKKAQFQSGIESAQPEALLSSIGDWFLPKKVADTCDAVTDAASSIACVSDKLGDIMETMKNMVTGAGGDVNVVERVLKILISSTHLMYSQSIGTLVTVFVQFLVECKLVALKHFESAITLFSKIYNWLWQKFYPNELPQDSAGASDNRELLRETQAKRLLEKHRKDYPIANSGYRTIDQIEIAERTQASGQSCPQFTDDEINSCISLILVMFGSALGTQITKDPKGYFQNWILRDMKEAAQTSTSLINCFKTNFSFVTKAVQWLKYYVLPTESAHLSGLIEDGVNVREWYDKCIQLINPAFKAELKGNTSHIMEVYLLRAYGDRLIESMLPSEEQASNTSMKSVSMIIRDIQRQMRTLEEELTLECLAPTVRIEPFVMQISGESEIGKSYIIDAITVEICKTAGIRTNKPKYVVCSGNRYWNGCDVQPVCVLDDFLQIQEESCVAEGVANLFKLKSSQPFNPPIAELENKKIYYNPICVLMTSNVSFFNGATTCVMKTEALHRRRNFLIEARLKDEFKNEHGRLDLVKINLEENRNKFNHLQFRKCLDTHQETGGDHVPWTDWMEYEDMLKLFRSDFKTYMTHKRNDYITAMERFKEIMPDANPSVSLKEYREVFIEKMRKREMSITPTEAEDMYTKYSNTYQKGCGFFNGESMTMSGKVNQFVTQLNDPSLLTHVTNLMNEMEGQSNDIVGRHLFLTESAKIIDRLKFLDNVENDESSGTCAVHTPLLNANHLNVRLNKNTGTYTFLDTDGIEHVVTTAECEGDCCLKDWKMYNLFISQRLKVAVNHMKLGEFNQVESEILTFYAKLCEKAKFEWHEIQLGSNVHSISSVQAPTWSSYYTGIRKSLYATRDQIKKYMDLIKDTIYKWYMTFAPIIKAGLLLLGLTIGAYGVFKACTGDFETARAGTNVGRTLLNVRAMMHEGVIYDGGAVSKAGKAITAARKSIAKQTHRMITQRGLFKGESNVQQVTDIRRLVSRNTVYLSITGKDGKREFSNATGIAGRILVTAGHYVDVIHYHKLRDPDQMISIEVNGSDGIICRVDQIKFYYDREASGLAFMELPSRFPAFRDLRPHIATMKDQEMIAPHDCEILDHMGKCSYNYPVIVQECEGVDIQGTETSPAFFCESVFMYNKGRAGMCGSCLISMSPHPRIIGIHIAGDGSKVGFAEPISYEAFSELDKLSSFVKTAPHPDENIKGYHQSLELVGNFIVENTIERGVRMSMDSKYEKTEMFGVIEPTENRPARLNGKRIYTNKDGTPHELTPLEAGIKKHGNPPIPFKPEYLSESKRHLSEKLLSVCPKLYTGKAVQAELTDAQIFEGIPGVDEMKGIELHTSEGVPLMKYRTKSDHNKSWCFKFDMVGETRTFKGFHDKFKEELDRNSELRRNGIIPPTTFNVSLKDSLVSEEKFYKEGGTRIFSVSPLEFSWTIKKYFGWFQASYIRNRIKSETTVGINPDSVEWSQLLRYFEQVKCDKDGIPQYVTGDYKAFGDTLQPECIEAAFEIMIDWYRYHFNIDDEGVRMRRLLCQELLNAYTQVDNVQLKKFCGIHSGFALTVEINSIVNSLYWRCAWLAQGLQLQYFTTNVRLNCYGDDCISKISKDYVDKFNFVTIRDYFEQHGIKFTSASKDENEERPTIPLHDITYLKRSFRPHPTRKAMLLAPLPYESVVNPLNWYRRNVSKTAQTCLMENCRATLNNAYGLGPEIYENLRMRLNHWWAQRYQTELHASTWYEMDNNIYNN